MPHAPTVVDTPQGTFTLHRWPRSSSDPFQAWDGADLHVLRHLAALDQPDGPALILNDTWGALSVALAHGSPTLVSDSYLAVQAAHANAADNHVAAPTHADCHADWGPPPALVVWKLPKSNALLRWQAARLRGLVTPETTVVATAMTKHLHSSTLRVLEQLGPTTTTRAWKKARLALITPDPKELGAQTLPAPKVWTIPEHVLTRVKTASEASADGSVVNHANVFSRDKLDGGTALLLTHLPHRPDARAIADLGCGAGPLALAAALAHPDAHVIGVDQSYMAVRSARETMALNGLADRFEGRVADGLADQAPASLDLVLCNPPFHAEHTVSRQVASRMFRQAALALRDTGELWIVANRALGYLSWLKSLFDEVERVAGDRRFDVLRAARPRRV